MKKILLLFFLAVVSISTWACEINFVVENGKKETYKVGDEIIVKVTITYTHRSCELKIEDTKFTTVGMKVVGAKAWTEVSTGVWERVLKIQITENKENAKCMIQTNRSCTKEGGKGSLTLKRV
ncbi:MAG: hypothetical protein IPO21_07625 [Bacteroidales bacterium]|nr:hypothetical protein [Bacteroidales bacterium]